MPRVVILFEYPTLLGGERSLLASIERLKGEFEFIGLAPPDGPLDETLRMADVEVVPSPLSDESGERLPGPAAVSRIIETVARVGADLLHGNSLAMGRLTGRVAAQIATPCTAHLRDIIGLSAAAVSDLNGNARLIAVSRATRDAHVRQGVDTDRVRVIYNGVDLDRFRPGRRGQHVRKELGISEDALVLLAVGQIGLRKGWDVLVRAAEQIAAVYPKLHVVFAGERYSEKPETVELDRSIRERLATAMAGRAHFVGYRHDMPALMSSADLLVHPARQEPFGRVLLEAAASGLPIVATAVGGTLEMLDDGITARLVSPGDADILGAAISEAINDPGSRQQMARAARERVEADFSADRAAKNLADVWRDVLADTAS